MKYFSVQFKIAYVGFVWLCLHLVMVFAICFNVSKQISAWTTVVDDVGTLYTVCVVITTVIDWLYLQHVDYM